MKKIILDGKEIEILEELPKGYKELDTLDGFNEENNE